MSSRSFNDGAIAGSVLAIAVLIGSRGGRDLDPALFGYLAATFVAAIVGTARVSAFWRRRSSAFYGRALLAGLRDPKRLRSVIGAAGRDLGAQQPIANRSRARWLAHMGLSFGTLASFAITLPLVFGWLTFDAVGQHTYVPMLAGIPVGRMAIDGTLAWVVFHALSLAGGAVTFGAGFFLLLRLRTRIASRLAGSLGWTDLAPLVLLLAVAISGLALPASRQSPTAFAIASAFHELVVIVLLVSLPFTKLAHVFIRPLQIGVRLVRADDQPRELCAGCGGALAPSAQIAAVEAMLAARGRHTAGHRRHCPACKRRLVAGAHSVELAAAATNQRADLECTLAAEDA
jgi:hypothetical protein